MLSTTFRNVGRQAVQGEEYPVIHAGMANPFITAACDHLTKAF